MKRYAITVNTTVTTTVIVCAAKSMEEARKHVEDGIKKNPFLYVEEPNAILSQEIVDVNETIDEED